MRCLGLRLMDIIIIIIDQFSGADNLLGLVCVSVCLSRQ